MDATTANYIETTPTLHNHIAEGQIIQTIVEQITKIPDFKALKMNLDLLLHVALMIENFTADAHVVKPKGYKVEICTKVFEKLGMCNTTDEKTFIVNGLNFLHSAGKIRRIGCLKRILIRLWNFLINLK